MVASARARLLQGAQSATLQETFRQIADMDSANGPKFSKRALTLLAAQIAGRAYEPMLLELCHLVCAATLAARRRAARQHLQGGGFEWLFWGVQRARADAFRGAFVDAGSDILQVDAEGVVVDYPDGRFEVRFGRMAVLAALMEFLVSTLGYRAVVGALARLGATETSRRAASAAAGDLARQMYALLAEHLPPAQAQRKFAAMTAFLEAAHGPDFSVDAIDDRAVLQFWLRQSSGEASAPDDFRGFRATFLAFLRLRELLCRGAAVADTRAAHAIGQDRSAGELDLAQEAVADAALPADPLSRLQEEPAAAIKAFNKRELARLALPVAETAGVAALSLSYLRSEAFAPLQNRLSQALRRRRDGDIDALIAQGPDSGYADCRLALEHLADHARCVALACLHVLRPAGEGGAQIDFRLGNAARKAFRSLSRAGFESSAATDPARAPAFAAVADALPAILQRLDAVLAALEPADALPALEAEDRKIFQRAFEKLYGDFAAVAAAAEGGAD